METTKDLKDLKDLAEGTYLCKCVKCGSQFTGYKRSLLCYLCLTNRKDKKEVDKETAV